MVLPSLFSLFCFVSLSLAVALPHDHTHSENRALPKRWYHDEGYHKLALFRRGEGDGHEYPQVGSSTWSAAYPKFTPDPKDTPQAWTDTLNEAVSAGKIPNIPRAHNTPQTNPVYPRGTNPMSDEICSTTYKCRSAETVWDAPDGMFATSFDDGPQPASNRLYDFLAEKQETATLFMIGVYILENPKIFERAFAEEHHDIAVHTYTHPYMTTLSNEDIVAQLGWTMQIIHDSTGGRLPRYWRPPYGDSDTRVRAIAREVFGLETVIWNQDTADWSLTTGGTTLNKINQSMTEWLEGPKSPGLVVLEHELSDQSVQAFIDAYPVIKENGWQTISVAQMIGSSTGVYQNANGATGDVVYAAVGSGETPDSPQGSDPALTNEGSSSDGLSASASSGSKSAPSPSTSAGSSQAQTDNGALQQSCQLLAWTLPMALVTLLL